MKSSLLLIFVLHNIHAISIGKIHSASLTLINSSPSNTMNGTDQECLCVMVTSRNISALNYFSNNTCQFFSNTSLTNAYFSWTINVNSLFYFLHWPTKADNIEQYTTVAPVTTTAATCAIGKHNRFALFQVTYVLIILLIFFSKSSSRR